MKGVFLEGLTWPEARAEFKRLGAVAIPIGAVTKEHGPHLPLKTDYLLADHWRKEVANRFPIIVAPVVEWGYYPAFVDFPGTVSLRYETFINLVADICHSFIRNGIKRLLLLNTGVSTIPPLQLLVRELNERNEGVVVGLMNLVDLGREEIEQTLLQPCGSHADEMETSLILALDEGLVDMSKAGKDLGGQKHARLIQIPSRMPVIDPDSGEETSGVFGDATLASREKGVRFWKVIFGHLEAIDDFLANQPAHL